MKKAALLAVMTALFLINVQSLSARSYDNIITSEYLQETFTFQPGEKMKHAECGKRSYPTCTYVWGKPSSEKRKAIEKKYGLAPEGKKLMVVYAQVKSQKDFDRVLKVYKDAVEVKGLGSKAVWSAQRKQLSLITKDNLIIHVNVDGTMCKEPMQKAKTTAKQVLQKL